MTTDPPTYHPAWEYWGSGWPLDTWLRWSSNPPVGDRLTLNFPRGLVGIRIDNAGQLDALAWAEAKLGKLPRTWSSSYHDLYGVRVFRVPTELRWDREFVVGNLPVVAVGVPVAPSPHSDKYGRYLWRTPGGGWSSSSPPFENIPRLPAPWIPELGGAPMFASPMEHAGMNLRLEDVVRKFACATVVHSQNPQDRMTTEQLYDLFGEWADLAGAPPVSKIGFSRVLAVDWEWNRWAGRTEDGFRRGYSGIRLPLAASTI